MSVKCVKIYKIIIETNIFRNYIHIRISSIFKRSNDFLTHLPAHTHTHTHTYKLT